MEVEEFKKQWSEAVNKHKGINVVVFVNKIAIIRADDYILPTEPSDIVRLKNKGEVIAIANLSSVDDLL